MKRHNPTAAALAALDGLEVAGGCDDCNAIQTLSTEGRDLFRIEVAHDPWCPTLHRINLKRGRL